MGTVRPCIAGPRRPQDRIPLDGAKATVRAAIAGARGEGEGGQAGIELDSVPCELVDGAVAIAAITSCTNTSNPAVMLGGGPPRRARPRPGLERKAMGQDEPRAGFARREELPREGPGC